MYALTSTGGAESWGWNYYGQLGVGTDTGPDICGWGSETYPIGCAIAPVAVRGLGSGVSAIAAGYASACALTTAGGVWCWGYDAAGQLGDGTAGGPEGCGEFPTPCSTVPVPVSGLEGGVSAIGGGYDHACAVIGGGSSVECWGANRDGELGDGTTTKSSTPVPVQLPSGVRVTDISGTGGYHTCAVTSEGGVLCWGYNAWGQLGDGTDTGPQECPDASHPCSTTPVAVQLPAAVEVTAVATGGYHACGITGAGGVLCWGRNHDGELGDGTTDDSSTPVAVRLPEGVRATAIASAEFHTCAVTSDGGVLCWGENSDGQLGDGTDEGPETCGPGEIPCSTTPVAVSGLEGSATGVATGGEYSCAAMEAGGVECWGFDRNGALGNGEAFSLAPVRVSGLMSSMSVSVSGAGSGVVSSSPVGIDCGGAGHASCGALFAPDSTVLLSAAPTSGSGFVGFTGGGCGGAASTCAVSMGEGKSVSATFALLPSAAIGAPADGGTYARGQIVRTTFSCADGPGSPGLTRCDDSNGTDTAAGGSGRLDTSAVGKRDYTVTATSRDGLTSSASIAYTVVPVSGGEPGPPGPGPPGSHPATPRVSVRGGHAFVTHRRAQVRLSCVGGAAGDFCRGALLLSVRGRVVGHRRTARRRIVLGRSRYAVPAGESRTIRVRLRRAALVLLERRRRPRVRLSLRAHGRLAVRRTIVLRRR
jgi:alpha-tubulin suppressor-like RCC1 family protein